MNNFKTIKEMDEHYSANYAGEYNRENMVILGKPNTEYVLSTFFNDCKQCEKTTKTVIPLNHQQMVNDAMTAARQNFSKLMAIADKIRQPT